MARISKRLRRLWDTYSFEGFRAEPVVRGVFGDPKVRIVTLKRRSKKHRVDAVAASRSGGTTAKSGRCVTCPAGICEYCLNWRGGAPGAEGPDSVVQPPTCRRVYCQLQLHPRNGFAIEAGLEPCKK